MREINVLVGEVQTPALDAALKAVVPGVSVSTYGPTRPVSIWMPDGTVPADDTAALAAANAHDPVFLSVDRTSIPADGTTEAVVTVRAPKQGAAAVSLVVAGTVVPVTLVGGVGTIRISSADPTTIVVSVQNPANRTTDTLTVEAT